MLELLQMGLEAELGARLHNEIMLDDVVYSFIHGVVTGLERHAWMKDGIYYVGNGTFTLTEAVTKVIEEINDDIRRYEKTT